MTMDKICYKAVNYSAMCGFTSSMGDFLPSNFMLKYKLYHTTIPNFGKIFLFDTYDNAYRFCQDNVIYTHAIFSGLATDVSRPKYISDIVLAQEEIERFWKNRKNKLRRDQQRTRECIKGTMFCTSFTPSKIVFEREYNG
jgi:hypothetical protein